MGCTSSFRRSGSDSSLDKKKPTHLSKQKVNDDDGANKTSVAVAPLPANKATTATVVANNPNAATGLSDAPKAPLSTVPEIATNASVAVPAAPAPTKPVNLPEMSRPARTTSETQKLATVENPTPVIPASQSNAVSAKKQQGVSLDDFSLIKVIGRGSLAKVLQVEHKKTGRIYAMKAIKKIEIEDDEDVAWLNTEKRVFEQAANSPFLVGLHACFQSDTRLFFVIDFISGGDLMFHTQRERKLPENHARFYAAEIAVALHFLHSRGIIYRDLKLDNVLIDLDGHIKLTDYGMCKEGILTEDDKASTFCGTPTYIAPEILKGAPYGFSVDWWALGVLLYEMMAGRSPYESTGGAENPEQNSEDYLFQMILDWPIRLPRSFSSDAMSVLKGFLTKDPRDRLACGPGGPAANYQAIRDHSFFRALNWELLEKRQLTPPYIPSVSDARDLSNFSPEYTDEPAQLSPDDPSIIDKIAQNGFEGFEYVSPQLTSANCAV